MATAPVFIERDAEGIAAEMRARYSELSGKPLYPAQAESLLIDACAYRIAQHASKIQLAAVSNLVEFSEAPVLDFLADLVGVERLAAQPAKVMLTFQNLGTIAGIIPSGFRVATQNGQLIFETVQEVTMPSSEPVTVEAECQTEGIIGNGVAIGQVTEPIDQISGFVTYTVSNTTVSSGGTNQETDEALRSRIKQAPNSFSVAGPSGAYKFWALSANPDIADIAVTNPIPGTVNVYVLASSEATTTTSELITQVEAILNDESKRPLTDTVEVLAATDVGNFPLSVDIVKYAMYDAATIENEVRAALEALVKDRRNSMGKDLLETHITGAVMSVPGVYTYSIISPDPWNDVITTDTEYVDVTIDYVGCTSSV